MLFFWKTVKDRVILSKFWAHRILRTTPLAPLKNLDFFENDDNNVLNHYTIINRSITELLVK